MFLISIDTLRSDRLPDYGYGKIQTPAISSLAKDSIRFERAFSHVPLTLPSHASILTGKLPGRHGVRDNLGYVLGEQHETLAEILRAHGYATGAAVSTYVLRRSTGIAQGFDHFDDDLEYDKATLRTSAERDGDRTRLALERWLDATTSRRLLGFLHLYEPHATYSPPAAFAAADPYDGEIRYADAIVGRFVESLKRRGLYDDAIIVLFSDHGEGLGEHGEIDHGVFVYRESLQVPLFVKLPRRERAGETVAAVTGLSDLTPTILARLGVHGPHADGSDLISGGHPSRRIYAESYFPRLHFGWHELHALIDDTWHYIDAPDAELYRLPDDPGEISNLVAVERRTAFALKQELSALRVPFAPPTAVDPEDQRRLASLGYLGSGSGKSGALPDPKSKIAALAALKQGAALVERGDDARALRVLTSFVAKHPDMVDGWWLLGQTQRKSGLKAQALVSWKEGLARFPTNSSLALSTADLLFETGRVGEAEEHARLARQSDPVPAHELLARMAMRQRDWGAAEREARLALAAEPRRAATLVLLARILEGQGRRAEQLQALDQAAALIASRGLPPIRDLHFRRGEALLALRNPDGAERAFRSETEAFPAHEQAWVSLATVVGARGRVEEARSILETAMRENRTSSMRALAIESAEVMGDAAFAAGLRAKRHKPE